LCLFNVGNRLHNDFESGVFPSTFMDKAFATNYASALPIRKVAARTALVGLDEPSRALLAECFRQFGIETVPISANAAERLRKEKFEACVLNLGNEAAPVMEAARTSPSNSRCIIYGVGGNAQQAMSFSKYGINAMFNDPLERPAALKLVRATRMLVQHEFRRYVRIPVMTEVSLVGDGRRISASSIEISTGGMSIKTSEDFSIGVKVDVSFALMTLPRIILKGLVSWRKPKSLGVRFDPTDDGRHKLKVWIDSYLEN
jgi:Tfp pilus assembly protein PilZ